MSYYYDYFGNVELKLRAYRKTFGFDEISVLRFNLFFF